MHLRFTVGLDGQPGRWLAAVFLAGALAATAADQPAVETVVVTARHGLVVAGHPEAAAAGLGVLVAGGNAADAAVAVSLALGVAEPYGSGLGGKFTALYYEARTRRVYFVDGLDRASEALDVTALVKAPASARREGWSSVCVPGLAAGLWALHQRWGGRPWAEDVRPAIELAHRGFTVLPKTRDFFEEHEAVLRRGDPEIARLYLPGGQLPTAGMRLANPDLATTMEEFAAGGLDGFYRGNAARAMVAAAQQAGVTLTREDFSRTRAAIVEPVAIDFQDWRIVSAPPPTYGSALFLTMLKVVENDSWEQGGLRTAANLDRLGRVWREVRPLVQAQIADTAGARAAWNELVSEASIARIRRRLIAPPTAAVTREPEPAFASTTHFVVVDATGNIVCVTQSQSQHFGAGVVAPGTGVVMNNSLSNFSYSDPAAANFAAPGKRPYTTVSPTLVFRDGAPVLALGLPGATRIPTAMLQVLLDHLALRRPLAAAIADTRFHFSDAAPPGEPGILEVEDSLPAPVLAAMQRRGWSVVVKESAGRGRHFGGFTAVEFSADGTLTGYADPRRTNAAAGW